MLSCKEKMKRIFELMAVLLLLPILMIPMLLVVFGVLLTSRGGVLYWSERVGRGNVIFSMPKFRTMRSETPEVATHLMSYPDVYLSPIGGFLRRTSLDEMPQLFSILNGDMSFVGPRPALFNQDDLIALRTEQGVDRLKPGITGWAQVNGRDTLSITEKVVLDVKYLQCQSFWFDLKILWMTMLKVLWRKNVLH